MIHTYAYDIECIPNMFAITIVDVSDYLRTFADSVDNKNKPIPLIQKFTVADIKSRLDKVNKYQFYITDTDDSQLFPMLKFINDMRAHYEDDVAVRCDVFGYNSSKYDKLMIAALLMYHSQCDNTKELCKRLYETSKHIIDMQNNKEFAKHDYMLNTLHKYNLPYVDVDVMTIFALNKVGVIVNKDGTKEYYGKSLKQTSINLQWYELLEWSMPPISTLDEQLYTSKAEYRGMSCKQLNKLISKWDRYVIPEWIAPMMHYNLNDVYIVAEIIRLFIDEIKLRYNISKSYGVNVLSSSRSNIADKLFIKFYSEFSGLDPSQWRGKKTERTALSFKRIIFDFIKFKTKPLQELLDDMKNTIIYGIGKKALKEVAVKHPEFKYIKSNNNGGWFEIKINNLTYTIATGGLHSKDKPRELKSSIYTINPSTGEKLKATTSIITNLAKDKILWQSITDNSYIYVHYDIASFYPSLMSVYNIAPAHIDQRTFTKLITWLKDTRVKAKHATGDIDGIPHGVLAQALKIVINSIYGKMGFEAGDICDKLAVLKVTINGQLMVMMLCEELEMNGIEVMSANTDGIVIKLYKRDKEKFDNIAQAWLKLTGLGADSEEYIEYVNHDINSYVIEETNGKISYKGAMNPLMYLVDLQKGYSMPIVATAVREYFLNNTPILNTLYKADNILDFCLSQNVGKQFHVEYTINGNTSKTQQNVRYYASKQGGIIEKVHNETNSRSGLCAGQQVILLNTLDDKDIAFRNIDYQYYYKEALKIIDPIKLGISPNQKGNALKGTKSGKVLLKKYSGDYNTLFDDEDF